jgi:hypothetical protein
MTVGKDSLGATACVIGTTPDHPKRTEMSLAPMAFPAAPVLVPREAGDPVVFFGRAPVSQGSNRSYFEKAGSSDPSPARRAKT